MDDASGADELLLAEKLIGYDSSNEDGAGHIGATVEMRPPEPLDPVSERFWIPIMPASIHAVWHPLNIHGALRYRARRARGRFPWQQEPAVDLPDRIEAHDPASQPVATG